MHVPFFENQILGGGKCYRKRGFIARNRHGQCSLGAYIIVSDKKRSKHNPEPLNPASPAKTSRLPSHSTMAIVENGICRLLYNLESSNIYKSVSSTLRV